MATLTRKASAELRHRAARLKLIVFDVDGVLTDGRFTLDADGNESKSFHTQDGYGLRRLVEAGIVVAVITGRQSAAVDVRMRELGIEHVFQGVRDKRDRIDNLLQSLAISANDAAAVGDDIPDLAMFDAVACGVAVANAVPEVRARALLQTERRGGDGAVRELADFVLRARAERES